MPENLTFFVSVLTRFFFLLTPFFALTMFLSLTRGRSEGKRRRLALQTTVAAAIICLGLFFFGRAVFGLFGITVDAFRVGAGGLLFLSAVALVQGGDKGHDPGGEDDIAVVPLAMPVIVGPATTGALLVFGAELTDNTQRLIGCVALVLAVAAVGVILYLGALIERRLGRRGIRILSKVTGVVLAALAAQMILSGIRGALLDK